MAGESDRLGPGRYPQLPASGCAGEVLPGLLLERTKADGAPPVHPLFSAVEALLATPLTLTDLVIARAMVEIREAVAREKRRRGELG